METAVRTLLSTLLVEGWELLMSIMLPCVYCMDVSLSCCIYQAPGMVDYDVETSCMSSTRCTGLSWFCMDVPGMLYVSGIRIKCTSKCICCAERVCTDGLLLLLRLQRCSSAANCNML